MVESREKKSEPQKKPMPIVPVCLLGTICLVISIWIILRLIKRDNRAEAVRVAREHRMRIITVHPLGYSFALNDLYYLMKLAKQYDIEPKEIGADSYQNIARVASNSFEKHLKYATEKKQKLYSEDELRKLWLYLDGLRVAWRL